MITSMTGFGSARAEGAQSDGSGRDQERQSSLHRRSRQDARRVSELREPDPPEDLLQLQTRALRCLRAHRLQANRVRLDANEDLIRAYVDLQDRLKKQFPIEGSLSHGDALEGSRPDNCFRQRSQASQEIELIAAPLDESTAEACRKLSEMRMIEGQR